jgi:hypothetical protein
VPAAASALPASEVDAVHWLFKGALSRHATGRQRSPSLHSCMATSLTQPGRTIDARYFR